MERMETIKDTLRKRTLTLPDGTRLPVLGQGTWKMGEISGKREAELEGLQTGLDLGMKVIDTAEMYGDGQSEKLVGEAVKHRREEAFLVSKVYPHHATSANIEEACDGSLKRLQTDYIDLYLLHWRGRDLAETVEGLERLKQAGKILRWGVSNFDTSDMEELVHQKDGNHCATNQVLYHLGSRGIEFDLLPWQQTQQMPIMAYSPLGQGETLVKKLAKHTAIQKIAEKHHVKPLQIALAWTIREGNVLAIPKATSKEHVIENAEASTIELSLDDMKQIDSIFPKPARKMPLDII